MAISPPLYYYNFDVNRHIVKDSGKEFYCAICNSNYKYEYSLKRHVLRTHVNRSYIIHSDLVAFGITVDGHHKRTDGDRMKYSCNSCLQLFPDFKSITSHVQQKHKVLFQPAGAVNDNTVIIKCPSCKAEFNNMRSLNCHMRYHKSASWSSSSTSLANTNIMSVAHKPSIPTSKSLNNGSTSPPTSSKMDDSLSINAAADAACSHNNEHLPASRRRQLRQRSSWQMSSMFTCTLCKKTFLSYGSMLRHRKLSHDSKIKRRKPEMTHIKRKTRKRSKFCDAKVARKYYNRVAADIAFNVKNCIHGNSEHLRVTTFYIQDDSKTDLTQLTSPRVSKRLMSLCNIKTKPLKSVANLQNRYPGVTDSPASLSTEGGKRDTHSSNQTQSNQQSKSPDVYDRPGLWKFLCNVCLKYFPNTLELFTHQDTTHKGVVTTYMEVGKNCDLPLHAMGAGAPVGCIAPQAEDVAVVTPTKYTCTKCNLQFRKKADLHPHILECGKDLSKPLTIDIPSMDTTSAESHNSRVNGKRSRGWQKRGQDNAATTAATAQKKITDMEGFNVRKKRKKLLEKRSLAVRQHDNRKSGSLRTQPTVLVRDAVHHPSQSLTIPSTKAKQPIIYNCPYCSISFKYKKPFHRHVEYKCEMIRRTPSPERSEVTDRNTREKTPPTCQDSSVPTTSGMPMSHDTNPVGKEKYYEKLVESEVTAETFCSPQKSILQARRLAKFCHPARTCGPCFNCKKPNMARRYSHLQQRSENFVKFVKSKCKNISLQSCICKACEISFKNDYEKRKSRLERFSGVRKSSSVTRSISSKSLTSLPSANTKSSGITAVENPPAECKVTQASTGSTSRSLKSQRKVKSVSPKHFPRSSNSRRSLKSRTMNRQCVDGVSRRKQANPVQAGPVQTKSLEQIFPEEIEDKLSPSHPAEKILTFPEAQTSCVEKGSEFVPTETDIIDVEQEMSSKGSKGSKDSEKFLVDGGTRLQVILDFVKNSPKKLPSKVGRRSSLTDIIDAVTQRVKEDPSLAETLTKAINAAAVDTSEGDMITRQKRYRAKGAFIARESTSLPSVLDGLATKNKVPTAIIAPSTRQEERTASPEPSSSIDLPPSNVNTTLPPPSQLTGVQTPSLSHSPPKKKSFSKSNSKKLASKAERKRREEIGHSSSDVAQSYSKYLYRKTLNELFLEFGGPHSEAPSVQTQSSLSPVFPVEHDITSCLSQVASATVATVAPQPSNFLCMKAPLKRRRSGSSSSGSRTSGGAPKAKVVMSESSHKHMVDIIDSVARGEISVLFDSHSNQTMAADIPDRKLDSPKSSAECTTTLESCQPASPGSVASSHSGKNARLDNIIRKLSSSGQAEKLKAEVSAASPITTCSLNPSSIDSGFVSLTE